MESWEAAYNDLSPPRCLLPRLHHILDGRSTAPNAMVEGHMSLSLDTEVSEVVP
jgi:hypothetical protein